MDVIRDEVTRYATDTRHRPHQYETPQQIAQVMRKMLASHIRVVPWGAVYLHVSPGDYQRIIKRSAPLELGTRVAPPAEFYAALPDHIERSSKENDGIYEAFCEHVYPELKKPSYERSYDTTKDEQRALAIFLSQATNGDTRQVINKLYPDDKRERERVYDATIAYGPLKDKHDSNDAVAKELGYFLRSLYFPNVENGQLYIVEPLPTLTPTEKDAPQDDSLVQKEPSLTPSTVQWALPLREERSSPLGALKVWKEQHALSALFPFKKAAKQMITCYYAPHHINEALLGKALGKFQHVEDLLDAERTKELIKESDVAQAYKQLISEASDETLSSLLGVPQVESFVQTLIDETPRVQLEKWTKQDVLTMFMSKHREDLPKEFLQKMMLL